MTNYNKTPLILYMGGVMSCLSDKSGCELVYLASSFAIALSQGLSCEEVGVLAAFLTSVGDNLAIIATQCVENDSNS